MARKNGSLTAKEAKELAKINHENFVRSTDFVEILDPEGCVEGEGVAGDPVRVSARGLEVVRFYIEGGLGLATIAERIGMTREKFSKCIQQQPELEEALAQGRANEEFELRSCVMNMARRGNFLAAKFLLESQHGWTDKKAVVDDSGNRFQVIVNAPLTTEEYDRLLQQRGGPQLILSAPKTEVEYQGPTINTQGEEVKTAAGDQRKD